MHFLQQLGTRERFLVLGAAAAVILALCYLLVVEPIMAHSARLDRQIVTAQRQLQDMYALQRQYRRQKDVLDRINARLKEQTNVKLFRLLGELAGKTNVRDRIDYMRPTIHTPSEAYEEEAVEIKMEGVSLEQLVRYLYEVERSQKFMKIKRLYIKPRADDRQKLTAIIRVSTFTPKSNSS